MCAVQSHGSFAVLELALTPVLLRRLAYAQPRIFPVLFDSAAQGPLGRYTILAAYPRAVLWQDATGQLHGHDLPPDTGGFLAAFEWLWRTEAQASAGAESDVDNNRAAPPFRGGWVVFLNYELAAEVETNLFLPPGDQAVGAFALRVPAALIFDHGTQRGYAVAESAEAHLLTRLGRDLATVEAPLPPAVLPASALAPSVVEEEPPERFERRVQRALQYIGAGDIYQANLSRPWRVLLAPGLEPARIYEQLRAANPAPFAAWARFQDLTLMSSSPERLVRVEAGKVEMRPIAGTRARSRSPGADEQELAALIGHPKERAEHVMLIDLARNDLGRVCRAGSVRADEFMVTESYTHVHHIVSNVSGTLQPGTTPVQVLRAVFPGGTITGCPKFRCMQIIAELEQQPRNAYTGALGYINRDGSMDFNILIRSLTMAGNRLHFRAGAGIVADSDWRRELAETRAKARGLLAALGL